MTDKNELHLRALHDLESYVSAQLFGPTVPFSEAQMALDHEPTEVAPRGPIGAYEGAYIRFRPSRRYVVGLLHPQKTVRFDERDEDEVLQDAAGADDEPADSGKELAPPEAPSTDELGMGSVFTPHAMAVSFKAARDLPSVQVELSGARYEPTFAAGRRLWRRVPIRIRSSVDLGADGDTVHRAQSGDLKLQVVVRTQTTGSHRWTTVAAVNDSDGGTREETTLFQAHLTVVLPAGSRLYDGDIVNDRYENRPVPVRGHSCAARSFTDELGRPVVVGEHLPISTTPATATTVPGVDLAMRALADWEGSGRVTAQRLVGSYEAWITAQAERYGAGHPSLHQCADFLRRIQAGIETIDSDSDVRFCFEQMNEAMRLQSRRSKLRVRTPRSGSYPALDQAAVDPDATWRPFQMAIILANIPVVADGAVPREHADVIWMPTGGGKTEAYLGLAAFTLLLSRMRAVRGEPGYSIGVTVLMRYTLRLLTGQQVQRAASTVCALDVIRRRHLPVFGNLKFAIGAWLGSEATPNHRKDAVAALKRCLKIKGATPRAADFPFLLRQCPWCAADLVGSEGVAGGYRIAALPTGQERVLLRCPDETCAFHEAIPCYDVDEDVYEMRPDFLVGTIDKFARLSTLTDDQKHFMWLPRGTAGGPLVRTPELVIQDELHLIDGPLGSIAGVYETVIEAVGSVAAGRTPVVIGATATTKGTDHQVQQLYGRSCRLVPPPGPRVEDGYFARESAASVGKRWMGVYAPSERSIAVRARVVTVLAQAAAMLREAYDAEFVDPWWTNVCFFQSRRDVGLASSRLVADGSIKRLLYAETENSGARFTNNIEELTAAAVKDVSSTLAKLQLGLDDKRCADVVLATSMIEVGLDSSRLGLMTILGQPKTNGQYVQVAGRVGRVEGRPGLVITVFNAGRPRDRSAYETFHQHHDRLYDAVEESSVTPWAPAAQRRALAGATAIWTRSQSNAVPAHLAGVAVQLRNVLTERVRSTDPEELGTLSAELDRLDAALRDSTAMVWFDRQEPDAGLLLLAEQALALPQEASASRWVVSENMRSVDLESELRSAQGGRDGVAPLAEDQFYEPHPSEATGATTAIGEDPF